MIEVIRPDCHQTTARPVRWHHTVRAYLRGTDCGSAISLHVVEESLPEREGFVGTSAFVLYKLQILRGRRDPSCHERWGALPGIARAEG